MFQSIGIEKALGFSNYRHKDTPGKYGALVIEEFKILQESCKQSWKGIHTTCYMLGRFLQDLNPFITGKDRSLIRVLI